MKKSITRIASIAALTSSRPVGARTAPGERQPRRRGKRQRQSAGCRHHRGASGELPDALLTLTTGQATQATTIFTTALNSITPIETQITTAQTALAAAIKTNTTATINTQAAAIGTLQGQIVAIQAKADAAFYLLLTTDQQTKLNSLGADFFGQGLGDIHIPGGGH